MTLEGYINHCRDRLDNAMGRVLPDHSDVSERLVSAIRYSIFNGGKRIRPLLVYAACQSVGGCESNADPAACAIELIHAYSLIHDDLPAMDDDDLRRGKPTCHKAYDEATAILAGDAMQSLAFELLSHEHMMPDSFLSDKQRLLLIKNLSRASGHGGMVGGQAMDLESVGIELSRDQLALMHQHKTGALIRASVTMGAVSHSTVEDWQIRQLDSYANAIGLAFQVQDDILDVVADTNTLGKQQGADQALDKPTYVSILGLEAAREYAVSLCDTAIQSLSDFDDLAQPLRQLAGYIIERGY